MGYSYGMKNNSKLIHKNERKIMSTNSKCKILLCLALPLTLATGYASDSNNTCFSDVPTPIAAPVSKRQAADNVINNEIFRMALADTNTYNLSASVNDGVVTMDVTSTDRLELQRMVNETWQLRGVEQVRDERGVDMESTLTGTITMAR